MDIHINSTLRIYSTHIQLQLLQSAKSSGPKQVVFGFCLSDCFHGFVAWVLDEATERVLHPVAWHYATGVVMGLDRAPFVLSWVHGE